MSLFDPYDLGGIKLSNRIAMAPMTRARNPGAVADELTALYYAQRASAGLIVTEGTTISLEAQGYLFVPGIWSKAQVAGWSKVTRAVHDKGGKIFAQLWHVGRMSHSSLQPGGAKPVGASAVPMSPDPMFMAFAYQEDGTPGRVEPTPPRALETEEVARVVTDFANAADNARAAHFDGVEVHAATGYLPEQFLNPHVNVRIDRYGGSIEARARFLLEIVDAIIARIGAGSVGVRLSPNSMMYGMPGFAESDETFRYLAAELGRRGIAYLHLHDVGQMFNEGRPLISEDQLRDLKAAFGGAMMFAGGLTKERAASLIERGLIDLAAFGQPYIANPDLVERFRREIPLTSPNILTYYGGDARGYTDYPFAPE